MDTIEQTNKSKIMKSIKSYDTKIEILLRHALWHSGIRYRKNVKDVIGTPDICIKKYKLAIFCDGDFWHGKTIKNRRIKTNTKFWNNKIKRNKERDLEITITLRDKGWTVVRFWESTINSDLTGCVHKVIEILMQLKKKHDSSNFRNCHS